MSTSTEETERLARRFPKEVRIEGQTDIIDGLVTEGTVPNGSRQRVAPEQD